MGYAEHTEYIEWFAIIIALDAVSSILFARLREQDKAIRFALIRLINIFVNIVKNYLKVVQEDLVIVNLLMNNLVQKMKILLIGKLIIRMVMLKRHQVMRLVLHMKKLIKL